MAAGPDESDADDDDEHKARSSPLASPTKDRVSLRTTAWQATRQSWAAVPLVALDHAWQWLLHCFRQEITAGNTFSWYVVAYAVGAALYLALPAEPSFAALSGLLSAICAVWLWRRQHAGHVFVLTLVMMLIAGVWTGSWKSLRSAAPRLDHERTVTVTGWIADEETVLKGATRMTIRVAEMTGRGLPTSSVPNLITVTFRAAAPHFSVGDGIRFLARLRPLDGPVMPGGYDFARKAYFDGRGGTGYALGRIAPVNLGPADWTTRTMGAISDLRHTMSERIRAALPGARGAIAAAIILGEQRAIPDAENDAIRIAGLPHMITIAGLHMSIVAGCVFIAIRWALALIPMIALTYPIKKWAAAGALVATTFYLLISGTHVSAERAYLMGAIMLLAIIFGRPALTMRNLALAALVLIVRDPEQVVEPGFLMSFLAVMALIAAYRAYWAYRQTRPEAPDHAGPLGHVTRHILNHGLGAMWSTLIATFATAFVTADQFYRVPPFGALSNMIVLPAIDLVAMPAAVIACLLMPFGLEVIPLTAMGWAIDFMNAVGAIAATVPGATGLIGRIHPWSVALQVAGLCWLCLWHRSWRLLGLAPIVLALCLAPFAMRPDIMVGPSAMPVAVRGADGQLKVLGALKNRFTVASWLTADAAPSAPADPRAPLDPAIGDGWTCDALGCVFTLPAEASGQTIARVAVVNDARGFDEDCGKATVVITRLAAPDWCADRAIVFDHDRLLQTGAVALRFNRSPDQSTTKTPPAVADATEPEEDRPQPTVTISIARPQQPRAWMTAPPMPPKPVAAPAIAAPAPPSRALPAKPAESSDARSPEDAAIDALDDPLSTTGDFDPLRVQSRQTPAKPNRYRAARPDILPFDPTDLPDVNEP